MPFVRYVYDFTLVIELLIAFLHSQHLRGKLRVIGIAGSCAGSCCKSLRNNHGDEFDSAKRQQQVRSTTSAVDGDATENLANRKRNKD